jgi:hypothetical protein
MMIGCLLALPKRWADHKQLATIMSFPVSHAFQDDGLGMIWDSQHSCWMEPNVNEHERAMGFHTHTTHLVGLSKANKSHFLDPFHIVQVMDLNYMTWVISPSLVEHQRLFISHPSNHPCFPFFIISCISSWVRYIHVGGSMILGSHLMIATRANILANYGILHERKG